MNLYSCVFVISGLYKSNYQDNIHTAVIETRGKLRRMEANIFKFIRIHVDGNTHFQRKNSVIKSIWIGLNGAQHERDVFKRNVCAALLPTHDAVYK